MVLPTRSSENSQRVDPDEDDADLPLTEAPEQRLTILDESMHGVRLDKALVAIAGEFSRNYLQSLIEQGHVQVDGRVAVSVSRKVMAGQHVQVNLVPTPQDRAFRAEKMLINIVFEDEHLMVIDKPVGLVVHPAAGHWSGTLLNGVLAHHPGAACLPRAGIVHRLDKNTSGLMVIGKTLPTVTSLVRAISLREVHREYMALVNGRFAESAFRVDAPLGRDPHSRVKMAVVTHGKSAQTDVKVVTCREFEGIFVSAIRCKLHTGRTHQIRVHLASRGHPLVADALYGGRPALNMQRQALHACVLGLTHPVTMEALRFEAQPPLDLEQAWQLIVVGE